MSMVATFFSVAMANLCVRPGFYNDYFFILWIISAGIASIVLFYIFGSYKVIIRHINFKDIYKFVAVAFIKVLAVSAVLFLYQNHITRAPKVFLVLDFFLTVFFFIAVRLLMIVVYEVFKKRTNDSKNINKILVYNVSDKSIALIARLQNSQHFKIVGFISRTKKESKLYVQGNLPVYYVEEAKDFGKLVSHLGVGGILFSTEEDARAEQDEILNYSIQQHIKTLIAPSIDEIDNAHEIDQKQIREIRVEDLLLRKEIKINLEEVKREFSGKVIMVTGAAGSIGSELVRQLAGFGVKRLILFDNAETPMHNIRLELEEKYTELDFVPVIGDVRYKERLDFAFRTYHPQILFHAAAYKHVPLMEENPCEAVLVNVIGSRNVADKAVEYGVEKMVMVSTDKAVNPTNIMGCSKRLAEIYIQSFGLSGQSGRTKFVTTRFGNVLGSNGSVIPRFREQLEKGGPITVTHPEITRFFMTIPEACRLVMEAATMTSGNQIFVFDMGKSVKIDTLARRMIELAGLEPDKDIKIKYTGLRPGEKLYEEKLSNKENTLPTPNERILIAKVRDYEYSVARDAVSRLEKLSMNVEIDELVKLMKEIVPEYISKNSRFEKFDKQDNQ
ncbi:MAG: polysaccharide biosynthesis protein [Bacteroidales bacterium]|nr:polysaccharide biosynthesis protein [Candidatus Egerieousia equi]